MKTSHYRLFVGSTALCMVALPAFAQTTQDIRTVSSGGRLEEIVVTAQRVQKNLQRTPVAVTSFNAVAIKQQGVTSLLNLNALAPDLSVGSRSGYGPAAGDITIRGIGIDANPPSSPAVGVYIDDVYFPGAFGNLLGLFDVSRVEVDRGPQGTLFGRNTIAGAIQYETVRPQLDKYSGFVEDTVGNLNRNDISAGVNVPISDIAALRVSGGINDRDGYVHDETNGVNFGADRTSDARAQLRIRPTADLTIDLKAEYVHDRSNGQTTVPIAFDYYSGEPQLGDSLGQNYPSGFLDQYLTHDIYKIVGLDGPDVAKTQFRIAQGEITYRLSDMLTLKSITAASANESHVATDEDRTPVLLLNVGYGDTNDRLFTQEVQVIGNAINNRLNFTLGGYFYDDITTNVGESGVLGIKLGPPAPPFLPPIPFPTNIFGNFNDGTQSYAGYGQATFNLTKQLAIVGGLRYTSEKATASDNLNLVQAQTSQTFTDISPMIGLNYQLTSDILLYFKDSRGFRAGGFSPNEASYNFYGPENATTYELGGRMEFLDRRLRVNPTLFLTDWNNIQFNASKLIFASGQEQFFPVIENAGNANIKGAEIELQGQVTDNFLITASGSLLDSKYTQIASTIASELKPGDGLSRSPQSSYTLGGRYTLPLGDERTLTFSANYAWQAHQRSGTTDDEAIPIPSYGLLNVRADFQPFGNRLTISGFATNLAGTKYYYGGTNFATGGLIPTVDATVGPPREYGITGRVNF